LKFPGFHPHGQSPSMSSPDLSSLRIDRGARTSARGGGSRIMIAAVIALVVIGALVAFALVRPQAPTVHVALADATGGGSVSAEGISPTGSVVAGTKASVSAKVPGRLEYLGVSEGSHVKRGEIIARLESGDYEAQLSGARASAAEAEAQRVQGERDLKRARKL